ncbi:MAG TPA: pyridoxal phosphate-dependent aminotransferase [Bryobacteraceae bacterium]|nr:pyridoxal phosphate-dependent aminotransferase [Bryobacteraceae bacterium]
MGPPFSARLAWSTARNTLTTAADQQRAEGGLLWDLTQSNPTSAGIVYPPVHEPLADSRVLLYEPSALGLLSARQAVCEYYQCSVTPDRVLLTASTSEAYSYLFKLLCNPGDEVLVPRPSYPLFDMLAQLESVKVVQYPLHYDHGWFIDVEAVRHAISEQTRAIIWVNPNNPTGSFLKRAEYEAIARLCSSHGLALIGDEVFADYPIDVATDGLPSLTGLNECLSFSLSGLSKVCGLPQMKLGWIVANGPGSEEALNRLEWIADTFLSVGTPVQCAAPALLAARHPIQEQIRKRTQSNLRYLRVATVGTSCRLLRVEAGWYATLQVPKTRSEEEWTLELLDRGVLVQPGFFFDFESEAYLIVSLLTEEDVFREGVRHILNAC